MLDLFESVPQIDLLLRQTFGEESGFAELWVTRSGAVKSSISNYCRTQVYRQFAMLRNASRTLVLRHINCSETRTNATHSSSGFLKLNFTSRESVRLPAVFCLTQGSAPHPGPA